MPIKKIYAGIPEGSEAIILHPHLKMQKSLFVCATEAKAQRMTEQLKIVAPELSIFHFPAWDCLPYDRVSCGLDVMTHRIDVLTTLLESSLQSYCLVTSIPALLQKLPPQEALKGQSLTIHIGQALGREHLLTFLNKQGYIRAETVRESGEYAVRGGIIDFFPTGREDPVRVDFFGEEVEQLKSFDAMIQTTLAPLEKVVIKPVNELIFTPDGISLFRTRYRELFGSVNDPVYEAVSAGRKYAGIEHWLPPSFFSTL